MSVPQVVPNSDAVARLKRALIDAQRYRASAADYLARAEMAEKMAEYYAQHGNVGPQEMAQYRANSNLEAETFRQTRKEAAAKAVAKRKANLAAQGTLPIATKAPTATVPPPTPAQLAAIPAPPPVPTQPVLLAVPESAAPAKTPPPNVKVEKVETGKAAVKQPKSGYDARLLEEISELVSILKPAPAAKRKRKSKR